VQPAPSISTAEPVAETPAPLKETLPIPEEEIREESTASSDVPTPVTVTPAPKSSSPRQWPPARRSGFQSRFQQLIGQLSQVPPPALIAAVATLLILIIAIIYIATRRHTPPVAPANSVDAPIAAPGNSSTPAPATPGAPSLLNQGNPPAPADNSHAQDEPPTKPGVGRLYEPGTYHFLPNALYVRIQSSTSESVTRRNAKFLNDHGVDIAIEKSGDYFVLIAAQPFASNVAAEPFVRHIRDLGKLHPDYRANRKVWADAAPFKVTIGSK
jgi:hypothetical protein